MFKRLKNIKRTTVVKNSFLIPILAVVVMSISHVISWYGLGNPLSWAIYLSIAVEIFALASVSAASINIKKGSIWFLFGLVTMIQIIGNIYFTFQQIDILSEGFKSWVELIQPLFSDWDITDHRRFLSYIQGGTLPFMSLIALHFYIVFNENENKLQETVEEKHETVEKIEEKQEVNNDDFINDIDFEEDTEEKVSEEINKVTFEDGVTGIQGQQELTGEAGIEEPIVEEPIIEEPIIEEPIIEESPKEEPIVEPIEPITEQTKDDDVKPEKPPHRDINSTSQWTGGTKRNPRTMPGIN